MTIHIEIAQGPAVMTEVRRLNHLVYAEELGQDAVQQCGHSLADPRLEQGVCFIARAEGRAIGMLAMTLPAQRFSIEDAIGELPLTPAQRTRTVELRRLAVLREWRGRGAYPLLVDASVAHCLDSGNDLGVISALVEHIGLYERLGYRSFGDRFRKGEAEYQPMLLSVDELARVGLDPRLFPQATRALRRLAGERRSA
ncbi:MAG: GNAT family N-acetyltransferase [Enhygromyxa sp.]